MKFFHLLLVILPALLTQGCNSTPQQQKGNISSQKSGDNPNLALDKTKLNEDLPLDKIQLPPGFKIDVFARVKEARSMTLSPNGTLFIGNRGKDKVYAVKDNDGDFKADEVYVVASKLTLPCGVAFKDGALYIAEVNKILKLENIENQLKNPPKPVVVYDKLPSDRWHGWKFISFGPDGKLYVPVGAPCNVCERDNEVYATICRMNPDGSGFEVFARGVRNSVGFAWHPETKELWFTDNGRDYLGNDQPDCELNRVPDKGMHFGFPFCHAGNIKDPEFGNKRSCDEFTAPVQKLGPHTAPLGMRFYTGKMFPENYQQQIFIARHGSWNRDRKIGYDLVSVQLEGNQSKGYQVFATGWLDEAKQSAWGRPVDVQLLPDGSMLVSDDQADAVYRIWYEGK